jgi:hypothetical protein
MRAIITGLDEGIDEDQQQVLGWSFTYAMNTMGIDVNGVRVEFHSDEECP